MMLEFACMKIKGADSSSWSGYFFCGGRVVLNHQFSYYAVTFIAIMSFKDIASIIQQIIDNYVKNIAVHILVNYSI